ncbi:MAG: histidine phosphatase family protein [Gammaproteobacteria bacterium]|nr:histidine phosphatase family protein [Gammaproteobacteria bacterium]
MKLFYILALNTLFTVLFWSPHTLSKEVTSEILPAHKLIKALQSGGHIIYVRHGPTNHNEKDQYSDDFENCSSQRNLSKQGRAIVTKIGATVRALKIPVGDVLSSPYCRCKDTAKLIFGHFQVEPGLQFSISKNEEEAKQLGQQLHKMMMNSGVDASNRVFVGHTANLKDGLGIWPKPEGVMVVFKKKGKDIIYKGMITPDAWPK